MDGEEEVPISPTILIQSIKPFSEGDPTALKNYFQAVEHVGRIGNWGQQRIFQVGVMKLEGAALECFNTSINVDTWEDFKTLLMARFGTSKPRAILRREMNNAKQRVGEDPVQFSQRLKSLVAQINPNLQAAPEEAQAVVSENLVDRFLDGLRHSLRKTVLSKQPQTWTEAVEMAQYEHQLEEMDQKARTAHLDAMPVEVPPSRFATHERGSVFTCGNCGQPGYWRCPVCAGVKFHAVSCPVAVPVTEDDFYGQPQ